MKKKICFIINPVSGIGKQKVVEKVVEKYLHPDLFEPKIVYTNAPKHAIAIAAKAAADHYDIVVAVGGDGSVNEVAKSLAGTKTALAIVPAGSGNGLARHLKIPLDLIKAVQLINTGKEIAIDTVHINDELFVNVAGIGFDAHIGWEFAKYGKRGFSSYIKIVFREIRKYKAREYELVMNEKSHFKKAFLISFANGSQWGNNAFIAPTAHVSDGQLKISILKAFKWYNAFAVGYRLFNKTLHKSKLMEVMSTTELLVKQNETKAHIDGEPVEIGKTIHLKVNPGSLLVVVPHGETLLKI